MRTILRLLVAFAVLCGSLPALAAVPPIPPPAPANDRGPLPVYEGAICTGSGIATGTSTSNKQSNSLTVVYCHDDLPYVRIIAPHFYVTGGVETQVAGTTSFQATIYYKGQAFPVLWSGSATASIGAVDYLVSDPVYVNIKRVNFQPARLDIRYYWSDPTRLIFNSTTATTFQNQGIGERFEFAASGLASKVNGGSMSTTEANLKLQLLGVVGPTTKRTFCLIGDSRTAGRNDKASGATSDVGNLARSIGKFSGYLNFAVNGATAAQFNSSSTARAALCNAYTSDVMVEHGFNDMDSGGQTAAVAKTRVETTIALFPTKRVWVTTKEPKTTSTSGEWNGVADQTADATVSPKLATFNADAIALNFTGQYGVIDTAAALVAPTDATKWAPNKSYDGLHANLFGYGDQEAASVVPRAIMDIP